MITNGVDSMDSSIFFLNIDETATTSFLCELMFTLQNM